MTPGQPAPHDRRGFLRETAARFINPLAELLAGRTSAAAAQAPQATRAEVAWLRPPGAVAEDAFLDTCRRCGACVQVCPARAIQPLDRPGSRTDRTPVINADVMPCVVCDGLKCTQVCPSGALLPLADPRAIRMGLARVDAARCVRAQGEACSQCVELCPLGPVAITAEPAGLPRVLQGCVGCGVCQQACPTTPRAITVQSGRLVGRPDPGD